MIISQSIDNFAKIEAIYLNILEEESLRALSLFLKIIHKMDRNNKLEANEPLGLYLSKLAKISSQSVNIHLRLLQSIGYIHRIGNKALMVHPRVANKGGSEAKWDYLGEIPLPPILPRHTK